jgi:uncharacterized membrane protein YeaQ/YmgE (transglycosylase-associated protein family)
MGVINSGLGCISWILFGALAGWIASMITGRNQRQGCIMNIIVGVIGAFIGGALYSLLTGKTLTVGWNLTAFVVSILGAVVLLLVVNLFTRNR